MPVRNCKNDKSLIYLLFFVVTFGSFAANAEPYLAVQQGLKCMQCHVNPTGGGERNTFGEIFAQNMLPARHLDTGDSVWTGSVNSFISIGGNLRAEANWGETRGHDLLWQFQLDQARLYISAAMIPDRLLFYVDELVAPGGAVNREAWGQLWLDDKTWYVKAGQMYLPFGLRLEDQLAFTRQIAGINMTTPDQGIEIGFEHAGWDGQLAITNGTAGGTAANNGKQITAQLAHVSGRWRVGSGVNINSSLGNDKQTRSASIFGGVRTGAISWLTELDETSAPNSGASDDSRITQAAALLEANWLIAKGHNLKITGELYDPNRSHSKDNRQRLSLIYECTPIQFMQIRLGVRLLGADDTVDALHQRQAFLQAHAFF